jgi:hypothetical protein
MKRTVTLVFLSLMLLALSGCGFIADGPFGYMYTETETPIALGNAESSEKSGEACVKSFFGMIAVGDASIETAKKNGGISDIYTVNRSNFSVLGMYSKQCTIVRGE